MKRVLVVDDDTDIRQSISAALTAHGHDVTEAANGSAALRLTSLHQFDLVVCDLFMPDKDGLETILAMRKSQLKTPIILITGGSRYFPAGGGDLESMLQSAEFLGITHLLMKPFRPSQLIALANRILSGDAT